MTLRYTDLVKLKTFLERYEYCRLGGLVGESTFGFDRYLNQALYTSAKWKSVRQQVIIRDEGCDLGIEGRTIGDRIIVHHLNPITEDDINERSDDIFNPEFLICVSPMTHNAIHYGDASLLGRDPVVRTPGDTCPWK